MKWKWTISCVDHHQVRTVRAQSLSLNHKIANKQQQQQKQISFKICIDRAAGKIVEMKEVKNEERKKKKKKLKTTAKSFSESQMEKQIEKR